MLIAGQFFGAEIAVELTINWPERINKVVLAGAEFWEENQAVDLHEPDNFTTKIELKKDGSHLMEWWRRLACGEITRLRYWKKDSLSILKQA